MDRKREASAQDKPNKRLRRIQSGDQDDEITSEHPMDSDVATVNNEVVLDNQPKQENRNKDEIKKIDQDDKDNENPPSDEDDDADQGHDSELLAYQRAQLASKFLDLKMQSRSYNEQIDQYQSSKLGNAQSHIDAAINFFSSLHEHLTLTLVRIGIEDESDEDLYDDDRHTDHGNGIDSSDNSASPYNDDPSVPKNISVAAAIRKAWSSSPTGITDLDSGIDSIKPLLVNLVSYIDQKLPTPPQDAVSIAMKKALDSLHSRFRLSQESYNQKQALQRKAYSQIEFLRHQHQLLLNNLNIRKQTIQSLANRIEQQATDLSTSRLATNIKERSKSSQDPPQKFPLDENKNPSDIPKTPRSTSVASSMMFTAAVSPNVIVKLQKENEILKTLIDDRILEIQQGLNIKKAVIWETESTVIEKTNPSPATILKNAMYETMESTLRHLMLDNLLYQEESPENGELQRAMLDYLQECINLENELSGNQIDQLEKLVNDISHIAEQTIISRDKLLAQYKFKHQQTKSEDLVKAIEQKIVSMQVQNSDLLKAEIELTEKVKDVYSRIIYECKDFETFFQEKGNARLLELLAELKSEWEQCAGFIEEIYSLTALLQDLEMETQKIVKQGIEKEEIISKVKCERLKQLQQIISFKEENKALAGKMKLNDERGKKTRQANTKCKKLLVDAQGSQNKLQEELRLLQTQLQAYKSVISETKTHVENNQQEHLKAVEEREALELKIKNLIFAVEEEKFKVRRLKEMADDTDEAGKEEVKVEKAEDKQSYEIKSRLIETMRKKVSCSVETDLPKEVILLRCCHMFSRRCIDNLLAAKNKKCPTCGDRFSADDVRNIYF